MERATDRKAITPTAAPAATGAYSPGLLADGWLFVSGQGPLDPATGDLVGETIEDQTERVLENIRAVLAGAGATLADVVSSTVHLADIGLFDRFDAAYARAFPDPKPARITVGSALGEGMLVEIAVIARAGT